MNNAGKTLLISAFPGLSVQKTVGPPMRHKKIPKKRNDYVFKKYRRELSEKLLAFAEAGYADNAMALLEAGADVNYRSPLGATPLASAASNGHTEVVRVLLKARAEVNKAGNTDGETPLHLAADRGHTEVMLLLLAAGADVNQASYLEQTPLYTAAWWGHMDVVQILLKAGADVNQPDKDGWTPLDLAIMNGNMDVVQILREAGAHTGSGQRGETPLDDIMHRMGL